MGCQLSNIRHNNISRLKRTNHIQHSKLFLVPLIKLTIWIKINYSDHSYLYVGSSKLSAVQKWTSNYTRYTAYPCFKGRKIREIMQSSFLFWCCSLRMKWKINLVKSLAQKKKKLFCSKEQFSIFQEFFEQTMITLLGMAE